MGILFAISVLALAALLWASLSIARHIRHERQRHASAGFGGPAVADPGAASSDPAFPVHELSFSELSPYGPTVVSRTLIEHAPPPPIPGPVEPSPLDLESLPAHISAPEWDWTSATDLAQEASPESTDAEQPAADLINLEIPPEPIVEHLIERAPEQITASEQTLPIDTPVPSMAQEDPAAVLPLESLPSLEALEEREAETEVEAQAAIQAQADAELAPALQTPAQASVDLLDPALALPDAIALTGNPEPPVPATAPAEEPLITRDVPTLLPLAARPPSAPLAPPLKNRLDWTYFNKDMGDLSDPLPSHPRVRHRPR